MRIITELAITAVIAGSVGAGITGLYIANVPAGKTLSIPAAEAQDDPSVVTIQEDDPRWDCRTMGDRSCGPTNAQLVVAGCYNDQAQLVASWPCRVVANPDGSSDVFTGR